MYSFSADFSLKSRSSDLTIEIHEAAQKGSLDEEKILLRTFPTAFQRDPFWKIFRDSFSPTFLRYLIAIILFGSTMAHSQSSPYFPQIGPQAIRQNIREIENPSVYLVIAIAPGFEDLASISDFRIGEGAAVSIAYVTNGEDIPSDLNGEMFYQLACRRKDEAYRALSYLGVESYFLNIPINEFSAGAGCFHETPELNEILGNRLDSLISQIKPDVIVIDYDPMWGSMQSSRLVYLQNAIVRNVRHRVGSPFWNVKRIFVQTAGREKASDVPVQRRDPIWEKSCSEMAREAEKFYESLRYQISLWQKSELHRYVQIYPATRKPLFPLDKGLPEIDRELRPLVPIVRSTFSIVKYLDREKQLTILRKAIDRADAFISRYENSISKSDQRVLITWKSKLEKLRCAILGVAIPYAVSDTVVTQRQLFFLRFGIMKPEIDGGRTQIFFPGVVQKLWIVNEAQKDSYDLKDSSEFRVLSPQSITLNSPETPEGFSSMQVRTPFIFIVAHQESNPNHNFMCRAEVPLIIAPYRSVEVLTPQIVMSHDMCLIVRLRSNVRDRSGGVLYVDDPIVSSPQEKVELPGKNYVVTDTVPLIWKDTLLTTLHEVQILAGGDTPIGNFVVHPLGVKSGILKKIGLCSVIENSPIQSALRRLGMSAATLDTTELQNEDLSNYSLIIIDQFSLQKFISMSGRLGSTEKWINNGGKIIVLPQYGVDQTNLLSGDGTSFSYLPIVGCGERIIIDSTEKIFRVPNRIVSQDFEGKQFLLSYGEIKGQIDTNEKVLIRGGNRILLLKKQSGRGSIFYCALNLYPGLLSIDENSYGLLANLISY